MKKVLIGASVLLVLLIAALAACEAAEWPFLRAPLEKRLRETLGRDVKFGGAFGVRLLGSLRVRADRIDIADEDPAAPPMVHAEHARLVLPWKAVLERVRAARDGGTPDAPFHVESLDVDRLQVVLHRDASGHANWQFGPLAPTPASAPAAASAPLPTFGELMVRDGRVRIDDAALRLHADATVTTREGGGDGEAGPPHPLEAAASSVVAAASAVLAAASGASPAASTAASDAEAPLVVDDVPGGLHVQLHGDFRGGALQGWLASSGVLPLVAATGDGPAAPIKVDLRLGSTSIRVDGRGRDLLTLSDLDGDVRVTGPSLAATGDLLGVTLPTTSRYALAGHVTRRGPVWDADVRDATVGHSRLRGRFRFDAGTNPHRLTGEAIASNLLLKDLGPSIGGASTDEPKQHAPGRFLPDREFDIPSLRAMDADVTLHANHVDLGTDKLADIAPLTARIVLHGGVLELRDLVASTADGRITGRVALDTRHRVPDFHADLAGSGIELARFLSLPDPHSKTGGGYISGRLALQFVADGSGKSTAAVLGTLRGTARVWVHGGTISHLAVEASGIDVAQALGAIVRGDEPLPLNCVVSRLRIEEGVVRPDFAIVDSPDTTLDVRGGISLKTERLDLDVQASPHDFSPMTLRTPVHVTGTFEAPHVSLEKGPLVKKGVVAAVLGAITPPAALLALLDFGEKGDHDVCAKALGRLQMPAGTPVPGVTAASVPAGKR